MENQSIESINLELHIQNTRSIYTEHILPVVKNLVKYYKKDIYTKDKALKDWFCVVNAGAKDYQREFGSIATKWSDVFSLSDRKQTAEILCDSYYAEIKLGNY